MRKYIFSTSLFLLFLLHTFYSNAINSEKPNVIFIYADDLGRGMLSHYGQKIVSTPNIDRIAERGVSFENVRGCMFCAPARASLITGYHDCHGDKWVITRGGVYSSVSDKLTPEMISNRLQAQQNPADKNIQHIGEVFKQAGYVTGQFGKLEWGFGVSLQEMVEHGWDHYCGYLDHWRAHGFYPPFIFEDGEKLELSGNTRADCAKNKEIDTPESFKERWDMTGKKVYVQNVFLEKILNFIRTNKDKPFFLYHPTTLPHGPVSIPEVHPDFANNDSLTSLEKEYASMVKMLDDHVGVIINELKKLGLDKNTVIIFSSDNGHEIYYPKEGRTTKSKKNILTGELYDNINTKYYSELCVDVFDGNDGMAGRKRDNWEGGLRVPLFFSWPGKIQSGRNLQNLVANYDIITTLADLIHTEVKDKKDGISLLPILTGDDETVEHDYVINSSFMGASLVTKNGWKLRHFAPKNIFQLYYLPDDYREERNLADEQPEKVYELKKIILKECNNNLDNAYYRKETGMLPQINLNDEK